jgi:multisubunit Na+/H+ antiporter MnhF subunit
MGKISIKKLGIIAIASDLSMTVLELLVIAKVLPYSIIGGGRLDTYEEAAALAGFSIIVQVVIALCIGVSSNIIRLEKGKKFTNTVLRIFTIYFAFNIILNLLGKTWFEKVLASLICIIQIVCFVGILRMNKRSL